MQQQYRWVGVAAWAVPLVLTLMIIGACGGRSEPEPLGLAASTVPADGIDDVAVVSTTLPVATSPSSVPVTASPQALLRGAERFGEVVLPIVESTCMSCHAAGQAGSHVMELSTVADVVDNADEIALQVQARVMPPWPASPLSVDFVGDVSLTDGEIEAIVEWAAEGAPNGIDTATVLGSTGPSSKLDERDVIMTSHSGPFTGSPQVVDDYRCMIFDPGTSETEWILATDLEPDQPEMVHHGIITMASAELREQADGWDALVPGPGWTCYGGTGLQTNAGGSETRVGGWAPGAQPNRLPSGYAIEMPPGSFFVVQIHYHYHDSTTADLSRFVLDLASDEQIDEAGGYASLTGQTYFGPAEIPCVDGDTEPLCERSAAVERVRSLYGDLLALLPDVLLRQCGVTVADFADMTDGVAQSTCDRPITNPGRVVSVTGHMHELGKSIRLTLNPGRPDERIMLDIPDWDFEWQFGYRPVDEIVVERGDVLRVECAWDRDRADYDAVGYILWAEGTGDEMCYSSITTAPIE